MVIWVLITLPNSPCVAHLKRDRLLVSFYGKGQKAEGRRFIIGTRSLTRLILIASTKERIAFLSKKTVRAARETREKKTEQRAKGEGKV